MHYRSGTLSRTLPRCLAWLLVGATAATTAHCAQPACERDSLGCSIPTVVISGTPRLSLTRDVTLKLNIKKQFSSSPTSLRVQQTAGGQKAVLSIRLQCPDLTACQVPVGSGDLKSNGFTPGEAQVAGGLAEAAGRQQRGGAGPHRTRRGRAQRR